MNETYVPIIFCLALLAFFLNILMIGIIKKKGKTAKFGAHIDNISAFCKVIQETDEKLEKIGYVIVLFSLVLVLVSTFVFLFLI